MSKSERSFVVKMREGALVQSWPLEETHKGIYLNSRRVLVRYGCCGTEEEITGQQYVYPARHLEVCAREG